MNSISINQIPLFDIMKTENNVINFKIGKLQIISNENYKYIHQVEIKISEEIVISFKDPENLMETNWSNYDFTNNQVDTRDYLLKYKTFTIIFKDFRIKQRFHGKHKKASAEKIIIKNGKLDNASKVNIFELIDKPSLTNGTFEHNDFKIDINHIKNHKIKENYNAEYCFSYECKYNEVEKWNDFIWKVHLMLRFYAGNLLFPQTKIIMDNFNNFEIIFNGFKSLGERNSIFVENYNNFSEFLKTSFEIFNEHWKFYNLLFTYWTNLEGKKFVEIKNLSGFVLFEVLVKHLLSKNKGEFPDKLYQVFISQNFDLKFLNKLFFKEYIHKLQHIRDTYLENCPNKELASKTFEFYETNFIIYYIQYYRNIIVHDGEIDYQANSVPKILKKIHEKHRNIYLDEYELPKKTVSDFEPEHENIEGTYWKGFRNGFKIGNELKTTYSPKYHEEIGPVINDIYEKLDKYFNKHIIEIMDPLDAFDRVITIFLIKLLNIECILPKEPKFYIDEKYIINSKEYISNFEKTR